MPNASQQTIIEEAIDDSKFLAIVRGFMEPMKIPYDDGNAAHANNFGFHQCPYPQHTPEALSWRIGWNDRALKEQ